MSKMNEAALVQVKPVATAVERFSESCSAYLAELGLPANDVLVSLDERQRVLQNVPALVELLGIEKRGEAMYVSKFIAACGAGLFDAALNFIWDEVVLRLRKRVAAFDLPYFFDTAVSAQDRQHYQTETDLAALSDDSLIRGALACGMLTSIGYKHLDYIRDMRNWASAAHPNHVELTGFQLLGWLETCLREVVLREPEGAILEVGRLLRNLREQTFSDVDAPAIGASVKKLPPDLVAALLRSLAGHYCDPRQDVRVRDNAKHIAQTVWYCAPEHARGEIGLKYASFAANGDIDRKELAHEFLDLVGGLTYLPTSDLALNIQECVTTLDDTHDRMNNFYNEPPVVRRLRKFIPETGRIPDQVNDAYVRVLVRCRVGRPSGVSTAATPIYDELIELFEDRQIRAFIGTLERPEVTSRLSDEGCFNRFQSLVERLRVKAVSQPMQRVLEAVANATRTQIQNLASDIRFKRLVAAV